VQDLIFDYIKGEKMRAPKSYWRLPDRKAFFLPLFTSENWQERMPDVILNFLCFIPFGFVLACIRPFSSSYRGAILSVAALSLLVEICQFGFAQRYPSALDWLMNVFGAMFGLGLSRWLQQETKLGDSHS
jgi:glycopeptide antibiotics resistance protein